MTQIEALISELRMIHRHNQIAERNERAYKIATAENYMIEIFWHDQFVSKMGSRADVAELHGINNLMKVLTIRCDNNCGIKTMNVYAGKKIVRTFTFNHNFDSNSSVKSFTL